MVNAIYFKPVPDAVKKELKMDRCLFVRIMGEPLADSRPKGMNHIPINTVKLKKIFKPIYEESELLQNLMIHSPFILVGNFYLKATKQDEKFINSNKKLKRLYDKDELYSYAVKDIDNLYKIYNDLFYSREYRITLEDAHNIGLDKGRKYISKTPRVELHLYYQSKPDLWYKYKSEPLSKYFEHMTCRKRMLMNKYSPKEQVSYLRKYITKDLKNIPKAKHVTRILTLVDVLEEYPADVLKEMAGFKDHGKKFVKYDAVVKIMLLVLKKFPEFKDVIACVDKQKH